MANPFLELHLLAWQRDGLLCTCAGACAGDHIQSWFLHEVGLRGEKINNG